MNIISAKLRDAPQQFPARTGITPARLEVLRQVPLFSGLPLDDMTALLADSSVRRYDKGALLFIQDEPTTHFYVVFEGWVKLFRQTAAGQESVIAVIAPGESFGEAAIFARGNLPVSALVADDATLLAIPADRFVARILDRPDLAMALLGAMSCQLRRLVQQVEHLTCRSSAERVANFLSKLCPSRQGEATVRLPFDKGLVAARLGMQPETFSRALAQLRKVGVVTKGLDVVVADVSALGRVGGTDLDED